ncbi:hypothetical protein LWI28_006956 [Acer negundo]|uniref:Uncharacterized protein n=1 Tax=Acer negundo TaxID=4023 RepID=A0AAD5NXI9_ACENE|nr:hypothetical protein LWI28_006956 [Acer negundo]KAK4853263.1 hypothetical protein QYF36_006271 [Acer negundo]
MMGTFVGKICRVTDVAYKCGCWIVPFQATCEPRISVFLKDLKAKILWLPWDDLIFGCIERHQLQDGFIKKL